MWPLWRGLRARHIGSVHCASHVRAGPPDRRRYSKAKTEQENELQRKGRRWLLCAAAAIAAYAYLSGYVYLDLGGVEYVEEEEED